LLPFDAPPLFNGPIPIWIRSFLYYREDLDGERHPETKDVKRMRQLHKDTVENFITETGEWSGFLASMPVSEYQIKGLWCFGIKCTIRSLEELEKTLERIKYHYRNDELEIPVLFFERSNNLREW